MLAARAMRARRALGLVAVAAVLANSTWFSATAVIPALERDWDLGPSGAAWLVVAVQLGFIAGNVGSALLNLADRIEPRRLIAASAIAAATANADLLGAGGLAAALPARFLVGAALAGVYAPCVRLVASHFQRARGAATAAVVGALTVGSGLPHLVRGVGDVGASRMFARVVRFTDLTTERSQALLARIEEDGGMPRQHPWRHPRSSGIVDVMDVPTPTAEASRSGAEPQESTVGPLRSRWLQRVTADWSARP